MRDGVELTSTSPLPSHTTLPPFPVSLALRFFVVHECYGRGHLMCDAALSGEEVRRMKLASEGIVRSCSSSLLG